MWDLTLEQGVGVPSIFASVHATALALELHDTAPTNGQKNLGQLFARFLTELLTEADGQLVGWTTRQAVIWAQICNDAAAASDDDFSNFLFRRGFPKKISW